MMILNGLMVLPNTRHEQLSDEDVQLMPPQPKLKPKTPLDKMGVKEKDFDKVIDALRLLYPEASEILNRKLEEARQETEKMKREQERGGRPF